MTKFLTTQSEYTLASRRIAGTREEKLDQLDDAIQELLDIKVLECAPDQPNVRFLAAPRPKPQGPAMIAVILGLLVLLVWMLGARPAHAQSAVDPPAGTPPPSTDEAMWSHVKFGATFEGYYQFNWNKPFDRVVPLRAYDTRSNSFSIQQAALIVDAAPDVEKGRRAGLRVDLQAGQATEALQGSVANEPRPDVYRQLWQAYGSYIFPVSRGLQVDFGKFGSNLGYETNYAKDDFNFSRAYLYNFLPYYHMGVRTTLSVSDRVTLIYMLTNGIQETEDFNNFKSSQVSGVVKPVRALTWTTSYYAGREQPDNRRANGPNGWFRVFDSNGTVTVTPALTLAFDVTHVSNQAHAADPSLTLFGVGGYGRYQTTKTSALAVRYERLRDDGLFGGITQTLHEVTLTAEYKLAEGFVARGEFRRDFSNRTFFSGRDGARQHQNTALAGLVWWIGNKTGSW